MTATTATMPAIAGYEIHDLLGQGGMATVYLATQLKLKRRVALKVILSAQAADPDFRERFISEGQLTARLFHRNVMAVFDIGESDGHFYLATELLPGGTLADRLAHIDSLREKLRIVREVAEGLGFAHQHQVVHRDIKPGNILFRDDGTCVVADFGIAKALDVTRAQTLQGMIVGTPSYMSPEQVQGLPLDGRSDLYSLGIMLYQMLTGELPFEATDMFAVAMAHITRQAPPLPDAVAVAQPLLDGMLAKMPDRRFSSAAEVCAAIDALLQRLEPTAAAPYPTARPVPTVSPGAMSSPRPRAKRSKLRFALVAGTAIAAISLGATLLLTDPAPPPPLPLALDATDAWATLASSVRMRIEARQYFSPAGASAHDALLLMLRDRPTNRDALDLVDALCTAVARDVSRLREAGDRTQASLLLSEARMRFPNHPALVALFAGLTDAGAGESPSTADVIFDLAELRRRAADALADNRISSPPGDNAVELYRHILRAAPDDADARAALAAIAADFATVAETWLARGNPQQAYVSALRGLEAVSDHPELIRLRDRARPPSGEP